MSQQNIPCTIISSWEYDDCSLEEIKVYNSTPALLQTQNFTTFGASGRCNITWNITTKDTYFWNVSPNGDTGRLIIQSEEDEMASLGVILFVNAFALAVFLIAFKVHFTDSEFTNYVIKKCLILLGLFFTSLNTVIVVTIADNTGLGVNRELFRYLWIVNWTIYVMMIVLFVGSVTNGMKLWQKMARQKRMGVDGDDEYV